MNMLTPTIDLNIQRGSSHDHHQRRCGKLDLVKQRSCVVNTEPSRVDKSV